MAESWAEQVLMAFVQNEEAIQQQAEDESRREIPDDEWYKTRIKPLADEALAAWARAEAAGMKPQPRRLAPTNVGITGHDVIPGLLAIGYESDKPEEERRIDVWHETDPLDIGLAVRLTKEERPFRRDYQMELIALALEKLKAFPPRPETSADAE